MRKVKKVICELCGQEISASNYSKHLRRHQNHPETFVDANIYHTDHEDLFCKFCGKQCKNLNSLTQHELRCKNNPNKKEYVITGFNNKGHIAWNKGLTKETDERIQKASLKISAHLRNKPGHKHTAETKRLLRNYALKNHLGGFHMRTGIYYNGVKLDSSYEVMLAENLDFHNIKWERCGRFPYHIDGTLHYYTPDFYLPDYDIYLDPKNDFLVENINPSLGFRDIDKIKQAEIENNIRVLVLKKEQLDWNIIKTLLL